MTPFGPWITLHRRVQTGVDRFNKPVYTSTDVQVRSIAFDHGGTTEVATTDGMLQTTAQPAAYLSSDTTVSYLDGITAEGVRYEVDGQPMPAATNPFTGWRPGVVVRLKFPTG